MKKLLLVLLAGVFTLCLGSCENGKKPITPGPKKDNNQQERHERRW